MVAGAVLLRPRTRFTVLVDDSKRLTALARRRAFLQILANAEIGIGIVEPSAIDTRNIFHASLEAMRQAVLQLPESPDRLLIDGPWAVPGLDLPMTPVVHGDRRSLAIACASIVAKVVRDELMLAYDRDHPCYGFARHKGYPTAAHLAALIEHGPSSIHRRSFRPVARLLGSDPCVGSDPSWLGV